MTLICLEVRIIVRTETGLVRTGAVSVRQKFTHLSAFIYDRLAASYIELQLELH